MRTDTLERASAGAQSLLSDKGFTGVLDKPWPLEFTDEDVLLSAAMAYSALLMTIADELDEDTTDLFETLQEYINKYHTEKRT